MGIGSWVGSAEAGAGAGAGAGEEAARTWANSKQASGPKWKLTRFCISFALGVWVWSLQGFCPSPPAPSPSSLFPVWFYSILSHHVQCAVLRSYANIWFLYALQGQYAFFFTPCILYWYIQMVLLSTITVAYSRAQTYSVMYDVLSPAPS